MVTLVMVTAFNFVLYSLAFASDMEISPDSFFAMILEAVRNFGGIPWTLKVASMVMLLISSMKVSFLRPLWDKLGWVKGIVAPVLGLAAGILLLHKDNALDLAGVMAYMFAGAGAIVLHEMLDGLKKIPGISAPIMSIISFFQDLLRAPKAKE